MRKRVKVGGLVFIRRSNDVIPEIMSAADDNGTEVVKPQVCPACGCKLEEVGAHIYCPDAQHCRPQIVARIAHYCSKNACDIDGISEKTVQLLVDKLGVTSVADLYGLTEEQLLGLDGIKDKKANNIIKAVNDSKSVALPQFIFALGLDNVGTVTAKDLAVRFESVDGLSRATQEQLVAIDGVGDVVAEGILQYFREEQNVAIITRLKELGINPQYKNQTVTGVFSGKKVVLTGSLVNYTRGQAGKLIEEQGGELSATVSKSVNLVVAGEAAGSKLDKARALGIEIIDEQRFTDLLKQA